MNHSNSKRNRRQQNSSVLNLVFGYDRRELLHLNGMTLEFYYLPASIADQVFVLI